MNGNNNTIKWVGIIVGILVALGGWFFAGMQSAGAHRIEAVETQSKANTLLLTDVHMKQGIVMDQLIRIRKDIQEIKQDIAKHDKER